jgi:hypothetical protein
MQASTGLGVADERDIDVTGDPGDVAQRPFEVPLEVSAEVFARMDYLRRR